MSGQPKSLVDRFAPTPEGAPPTKEHANQNRRPRVMLHMTLSDGSQWAEPYAYLIEVHMPKERTSINLRYTHRVVHIEGRNLQPLFLDLLQHQVAEIEVVAGTAASFPDASGEKPHITGIHLREPRSGDPE